jgi:hypothetical protein
MDELRAYALPAPRRPGTTELSLASVIATDPVRSVGHTGTVVRCAAVRAGATETALPASRAGSCVSWASGGMCAAIAAATSWSPALIVS